MDCDEAIIRKEGNRLILEPLKKNHGLTLVTGNTKEFSQVKGLAIENWLH